MLPVFFEPGIESDASTLFIGRSILAQFRQGLSRSDVDELGARIGFRVVSSLSYAPNAYELSVSGGSGRTALEVANACFESGLCVWSHPDFLAHRELRFTPNDPQFGNQWHLRNSGQGNGVVGADVSAEAAWDITRGSSAISVAVADTGIDYTHEDFAVNVGGLPKVHDPA